MYEDLSLKESHRVLINKIAELREVFPFPENKNYDNGYSWDKKDGWQLAEIVCSPHMCLDAMIRVSQPTLNEGE